MQTLFWDLKNNKTEYLREAADLILGDEVVAFPTETVYGLGANGLSKEAVRKIFAAKGRPADNPLILHVAETTDVDQLVNGLNENAKLLIEKFWPGPLTIIAPKSNIIPDEVSAGLSTVAIRMPSHPVAREFIKLAGVPLAAPSANISGKPSPTNAKDVLEDMTGKIAGILDGGECGIGVESTVVDTTTPIPMILRPGGITKEMLEEVLGAVEVDPALVTEGDFAPKAPGMKYKHYAPQAEMYLFEGADVEEAFLASVLQGVLAGLKVGVLCDDNLATKIVSNEKCKVSSWGSNVNDLAEKMYFLLRDFDRQDLDVILSVGVPEQGLGVAVMNRLRKAAGLNILLVEKGEISPKKNTHIPTFMVK